MSDDLTQSIDAMLVDIERRRIDPVKLSFRGGVIVSIEPASGQEGDLKTFLMPGFVDSHVHIESSMLTPSQFARTAVIHGTVATVSDPHEIANVLGVDGVEFMLEDASQTPFKFCFGAPSCVPATTFETAGDAISAAQTETLLDHPSIGYLAEMMNFPGVLGRDPDVMSKISAAQQRHLRIDGHSPGLRGRHAETYFAAGITTDHECSTEDEAIDKLSCGATIQIREGSAARNFEALYKLIDQFPFRIMFCSDDKHPDELLVGHINQLCRRAVAAGCDLYHTLRAACLTPVQHYELPVGQLRVGDPADFIEVDSLTDFNVLRTFIDGVCVAEEGDSKIPSVSAKPVNRFSCSPKSVASFAVASQPDRDIRVIVAHDGLLTTSCETMPPKIDRDQVISDVERDLLKLTVVTRYHDAPPALAFVRSFGLKRGAIAGSVAHDSHNIIAVGTSDREICAAVNLIINEGGGLAAVDGDRHEVLPLPIAGLMSLDSCEKVAGGYQTLDRMAKELGSTLGSPFMTLSFLALLVIPSLKLSDKGLFDGDRFEFVDLFV